jgi:hypothetical protein
MHIVLLALLFVAAPLAGEDKDDGQRDRDIVKWKRILEEPNPAEECLAARDALAKRQAEAATALLRLGQSELVWPLLRHGPDLSLRSYLVRDLGRSGISPDAHRPTAEGRVLGRQRVSQQSLCGMVQNSHGHHLSKEDMYFLSTRGNVCEMGRMPERITV